MIILVEEDGWSRMASSEINPVLIAMTGSSFEGAGQAGVERIEPDLEAMTRIARYIGHIEAGQSLPPLAIVTRDSGSLHQFIGRWDERLPSHQGQPTTSRFFPAEHLGLDVPHTTNRESLVVDAKRIGASALTEVSVASWEDDATHPGCIRDWSFTRPAAARSTPIADPSTKSARVSY